MSSEMHKLKEELEKVLENCASLSIAFAAIKDSKSTKDTNELFKFYLNGNNDSNILKIATQIWKSIESLYETTNGKNTDFNGIGEESCDINRERRSNNLTNTTVTVCDEYFSGVTRRPFINSDSQIVQTSNRFGCETESTEALSHPNLTVSESDTIVENGEQYKDKNKSSESINVKDLQLRPFKIPVTKLTNEAIEQYTTKRKMSQISATDKYANKARKSPQVFESYENVVDNLDFFQDNNNFQQLLNSNLIKLLSGNSDKEDEDVEENEDEEEEGEDISLTITDSFNGESQKGSDTSSEFSS